jgi:hypothetical protein
MPDEPHVSPDSRGQRTNGGDPAIVRLAARQYGVASREQLLRLGLGRRAIEHRIERGRLHPVHRGIYAVGRPGLTAEGRWMAAVLAAGPRAVLSHTSAGGLLALRPQVGSTTHVTVPRRRRARHGLEIHQASLPADEVTVEAGIPVTTVARTLLDLATCLNRPDLELAVNEAERRGLADAPSLPELVRRYPRRAGLARLRSVLEDGWVGVGVVRSVLEQRFLAFVAELGLPRPEVNAILRVDDGWVEVDCLWRSRRLIVELDGHAYHSNRAAYERDRERDRALAAAGWKVVRVTWRQLVGDSARLAADLLRLLDAPFAR